MSEHKLEVLVAQYDKVVQLYQHEDNLTWSKIQQSIYVNGALAAAVTVEVTRDIRWLLALGAAILAVLFLVTIEGSRRYMFARLRGINKGEQELSKLAKTDTLIEKIDIPWWLPDTTVAIRIFLWLAIVTWSVLAVIWCW